MTTTHWLILSAVCIHAAAVAGDTGAVRGRIHLDARVVPIAIDKYSRNISGELAPPPRPVAGVWLEAPELHAQPKAHTAAMEQRGYQFTSRLLIVPLGARVAFPNMDGDYHNVYSISKPKSFDIGRYKADEKPVPVETFENPGVVRLRCEIHEHMRGTIIVVDSPHFTRTGENGSFALSGIAPGSYTLKAWLDEKHEWQQSVTIVAGKTLEVNLSK